VKKFSTQKHQKTICTITMIILAALYFVAVATVAALVGQHLVTKLIALLGRASIIIFILALTVFVSGISLGKCFYFGGLLIFAFIIHYY
jgi:small-conductance mechanosensitive channel